MQNCKAHGAKDGETEEPSTSEGPIYLEPLVMVRTGFKQNCRAMVLRSSSKLLDSLSRSFLIFQAESCASPLTSIK
jgi:hypothetical protein